MFNIMGIHPEVEKHTSSGRIDLSFRTSTTLYIIELKIKETAQEALDQINRMNYAALYAHEGLEIVKIGMKFDTTKGTLEEWVVEK